MCILVSFLIENSKPSCSAMQRSASGFHPELLHCHMKTLWPQLLCNVVHTCWLNTWRPPPCLPPQPLLFASSATPVCSVRLPNIDLQVFTASLPLSPIFWYLFVGGLSISRLTLMGWRGGEGEWEEGGHWCLAWSCSIMRCWRRGCVNFRIKRSHWEDGVIAHTANKAGWWWEMSGAKN